jgi:beta-carotene 3-hydroxylase
MTPVRVLLFVAAFLAMEAVAAAEHRWAMHGFAWGWHRSHHQVPGRRSLEPNDRFPIVFATLAFLGFLVGTQVDGWSWLVPVAAGVTAYGASYALVHDGYIHGRLGIRFPRVGVLDRLAAAHALHHRFNGAPYGMLLPVVPPSIRRRAADSAPSTPSVGPPPANPQGTRA